MILPHASSEAVLKPQTCLRERPVALTDRAPDSKSGCWGFESLLACQSFFQEIGDLMEFSVRSTLESVKQFLREVKTELKKVTWPTRKDTLAGTAIVLVTVGVAAVFLFIVDYGLSSLIKWFLGTAVR